MSSGEPAGDLAFQLVVVGASAGGVEALLELVASLPADFPAPIVLAQHLDPRRPSHLGSLLANKSQLPVRTVTDIEHLEPGTIYVVPADRDVQIIDHQVAVHGHAGLGSTPSIDHLLTSAAHRYGEELIAVILTGTGSDGAAGAQAVKAYRGTVIIQNPETARFPGMPQAVAPAAVDIVADLASIGPLLVDLLAGDFLLPQADGDDLRPFLERLREQTGLDFLAYKRPTIERRLRRRMAAAGAETLADYRRYLDHNPDELQRLVASFLIKVTEFFRDPEVFTYLRDQILPSLIAEARERGELRLWSAGCATGEEAYSLAILVADLLGNEMETLPVRIFATDVAPDAVEFARRGVYPESALAELSPEIVARHFSRVDGAYEVRKTIRGLVVFGEHDLGYRAPFPRIDLVLCRNVLIYFTPELQRRSLQRFAFALRPGGILALGKSETVSPLPDFFALVQPRLKVFRRIGDMLTVPSEQYLHRIGSDSYSDRLPQRAAVRRPMPPRPHELLASPLLQRNDRLLDALAVGVISVNRHYDVLTMNIAARQLLGLKTPAIGEDLIHAVGADLRDSLRICLDDAFLGETSSLVHRLPVDPIEGQRRDLLIVSSPHQGDTPGPSPDVVLVQITDVSAFAQHQRDAESRHRQDEAEVRDLKERMAAAVTEVRDLRTANQRMASEQERLRAELELMQLAQEEALAAAEEIETLHEEQQATNEELETVNEELQATIEELQATVGELHARTIELESMATTREKQQQAIETERSRLAAILANMGDAVLVLDGAGDTVLTNTAYDDIFSSANELAPEDEAGEPLPEDVWPQRRAARGDAFTLTFTLPGDDGMRRWFEARAQPVAGSEGQRWGVLVIRDITERSLRRQQEQFIAVAAHELRNPLAALSGRLQLLNRRLTNLDVDERLRKDALASMEQARRLESHIQELLDATRIQFGQLSLELTPLDLRSLVQQVADQTQPLASTQVIHTTLPESPVIVAGDAHRLEQVLVNLLTNAITYAPETERIDLRLATRDGAALITVEDAGPGIPADDLPHIFDRFFHSDSGQSSPGTLSGLGLGLYISREIVSGHGGTIVAQSTLGEGTTFEIRLPLFAADGQDEA